MAKRLLIALLLLCLASGLTGCFPEYHPPRYNVEDRQILVLPFRESGERSQDWYGWSPRGEKLVDYFKAWVSQNWSPNFVLGDEEHRVFEKVRDWRSKNIESGDWRRLGRDGDFDFFLVGDIVRFRMQQPQDINVYRGSSLMSYRLIRRRTGKVAFEHTLPDPVTYGDQDMMPITSLDRNSADRIERGLLQELAERLGKDLYGYYDD